MRSNLFALALTLPLLNACRSTPPEPESRAAAEKPAVPSTPSAAPTAVAGGVENRELAPASTTTPTASAVAAALGSAAPSAAPTASAPPAKPAVEIPKGHRKVMAKPVQEVKASPDDPLQGKFSLEDALKGLTGKGRLVAEIRTDLGKLECELYEDKAPLTVANFVGLARGLRPFKNPKGEWAKSHAYDGTTFHRVVKGFMIQGGDPQGTGGGEPGYVLPDEIWEDAYHSEQGLLCMANRGPNTNGMQFFIMDGSAPHLDGGYTIFGKCGPGDVIDKLARVEVQGDRSVKPSKIEKVTIKRAPAKKAEK